jgi:UDP-GlcNAc:undecaprenyl-phosphate GlcNAc-1-phosphate transferase
MELSSAEYFVLFGSSFITVSFLTALMRKVALRYGIVDSPNEAHKSHREPIPYLGGVAIVLGVLLITLISAFVSHYSAWLAISVLLPALLLAVVGLIDDFKKLSPWPRFIVQTSVASFSALLLVATDTLGSPTGSTLLDLFITVFWIVGLANAVNFFDNVDGGASGAIAISSFFLAVLALQGGQLLIAALSIVLSGATLGFLVWNKPPARIYMGDAGSLFLGVLIASLSVRFDPNPINRISSFAVPFFLLAVPILDTSVTITGRIARGISPFQGGRDHLSHLLMGRGIEKRKAVFILWKLTLYFALLAVLMSIVPYSLEGATAFIGAVSWLILFFFFFSQREKSSKLPKCLE